jgi:hypothetical protein
VNATRPDAKASTLLTHILSRQPDLGQLAGGTPRRRAPDMAPIARPTRASPRHSSEINFAVTFGPVVRPAEKRRDASCRECSRRVDTVVAFRLSRLARSLRPNLPYSAT